MDRVKPEEILVKARSDSVAVKEQKIDRISAWEPIQRSLSGHSFSWLWGQCAESALTPTQLFQMDGGRAYPYVR